MMRFVLISGNDAPCDALAELEEVVVGAGAEAILKKHDDCFDDLIQTDIPVGESFGAYEALRLFNAGVGPACLVMDYVSKKFRERLFLKWPTALRWGCLSLHRPVHRLIYPRSTGVKGMPYQGVEDREMVTTHTGFRHDYRVRQFLREYIRTQTWGPYQGVLL